MHSSLIILTIFSIVLILFMVACFICFIRSRREEDEELVEQMQYNAAAANQQQQQQQQLATPQRQKMSQSPSNNMMINSNDANQLQQQFSQRDQMIMADYQTRNSYASSPYHSPSGALAATNSPHTDLTQTRSDITQQINSAIIGSSEAEFQNDFIQVFPMYQIAPQPEKNTTPYLT